MSGFFEGWYLKHQNQTETFACIPGFADDRAFIQVITDTESFYFAYPLSECSRGQEIKIGGSSFSPQGIVLDIRQGGHILSGRIAYTALTPLASDIMGVFRFLPMQCRHGVLSLHHRLTGTVRVNGKLIDFNGGTGYAEKDSGRSFPKRYLWMQSNDFPETCSVMAAVADIPFMGLHFRGVICAVWYRGREYRLATYNGAKVIRSTGGELVIQRGRYTFWAAVLGAKSHPLAAPEMGKMSRMIRETPSCRARFRFLEGDKVLFDMESGKTSFEFVE